MTVYVEGKGCGCMTEVFLDGFIVISVLERDDGKCVPQIVDADLFHPGFFAAADLLIAEEVLGFGKDPPRRRDGTCV